MSDNKLAESGIRALCEGVTSARVAMGTRIVLHKSSDLLD